MIRHGVPPFLECSSRGDKRFSALFAKVKMLGNLTIEHTYQAFKVLPDGTSGNPIEKAKGLPAQNAELASKLYKALWVIYIIKENPHLIPVLTQAFGLSDTFGQRGHCCQATELWYIRGVIVEGLPVEELLYWAENFINEHLGSEGV